VREWPTLSSKLHDSQHSFPIYNGQIGILNSQLYTQFVTAEHTSLCCLEMNCARTGKHVHCLRIRYYLLFVQRVSAPPATWGWMWQVTLRYYWNTCLNSLTKITKIQTGIYTLTPTFLGCDAESHSVTSQTTCIFSHTAVRTSNLARSRKAEHDRTGAFDVPYLE
jgi:hypothetical protein